MKQRTDKVSNSKDIIHLLISFIFIWGRATSFFAINYPCRLCLTGLWFWRKTNRAAGWTQKYLSCSLSKSDWIPVTFTYRRSNNQGRSPQQQQVWSLSSCEVSCQLLTKDSNQVLYVSLHNGPCQWRAFWADSAPFVDTGRLIVILWNYQGTRL